MNLKIWFLTLVVFFSSIVAHAIVPITTDARIKTLVYNENEVFRLKFHYNYQSYIELARDEKIDILSIGDSYAWQINPADNRIFIKPLQADVETNMTLITNKRPYHFELVSSKEDVSVTDEELVYVARFFYPDTTYDYLQAVRVKKPIKQPLPIEKPAKPTKAQEQSVKPSGILDRNVEQNNQTPPPTPANIVPAPAVDSISRLDRQPTPDGGVDDIITNPPPPGGDNLNFHYSIVGPESDSTPVKIYDDGRYTYFEFRTTDIPDIFYVNADGSETQVRYTIENGVVVVDSTSWQFSLRRGIELNCVFNENKIYF